MKHLLENSLALTHKFSFELTHLSIQNQLISGSMLMEKRGSIAPKFPARSTMHYQSRKREDRVIRNRIKEIAESRVRYGFWRIHVLLKREGWKDNHKRTYRIYREEGLNPRSKRQRRSKAAAHRLERPGLDGLNQCCSMNFVGDQLFDGKKFRVLTLKEYKLIMDQNLYQKISTGGAYENKVILDFSRLGKPTDNPFIESFNGSFRDECLNVNWFLSLKDVEEKLSAWKDEYNYFRPHSSLDDLTPGEVVKMYQK